MASSSLLIYLVLSFVIFSSATATVKDTCPSDAERLNCQPCRKGSDFNSVTLLPLNPNIAKMGLIKFNDKNEFVAPDFSDNATINSLVTNFWLLVALAVIPLVFGSLFCGCFCLGRYICCCCDKGGCCCGKRYPTPSRMRGKDGTYRTACMGFDPERRSYGCRAKCCAYSMLVIFLGTVLGMVYFGYVQSTNITDGFTPLYKIPDPIVKMLQGSVTPVSNFVDTAVGVNLVSGLATLNTTICSVVDLRQTVSDVKCMKTGLIDNFLDVSVITSFISALNTFKATLPTSQSVKTQLLPLNTSITAIKDSIPALKTSINRFDVSLLPFKNLSSVSNAILGLDGAISVLKPVPGEIKNFFVNLTDTLPNRNFLVGPSGNSGLKGMIVTQMQSQGCRSCGASWAATQSWRDDFLSKLQIMRANLTNLPHVSTFNATVSKLNDGSNKTATAVSKVTVQFQNLTHNLDLLPNTSTLYVPLQDMQVALGNFNFSSVYKLINSLNVSLHSVPSFGPLAAEIRRIPQMGSVFPCAKGIASTINKMNVSLITLPEGLGQITQQIDGFKTTIDDATNKSASILSTLDKAQSNLTSIDFSDITDNIDSIESQKNSSLSKIDFNGTITSLKDLQKKIDDGAVDSNLLNDTQSLMDAINSPDTNPSNDTISKLTVIDDSRNQGPPAIQLAIDAFNVWQRGFCVNDVSKSCLCNDLVVCFNSPYTGASADCGGNNCNMAYAAAYPGVCITGSPPYSTTCTSNADCGSNPCSYPNLNGIVALIDTLKDSNPDVSSLLSSMNDMTSRLNSLPNLQDQVSKVKDLENQFLDVPDLGSYNTQFNNLQSSMDDAPTTDSIADQVGEISTTLDKMPNLNETVTMLTDLNKTVKGDLNQMFDQVLKYGDALVNLLYGPNGLSKTIRTIKKQNLISSCATGGLSCRVGVVLSGIDSLFASLKDLFPMEPLGTNPAVKVVIEKIDLVEDTDLSSLGSVNFLAKLAGASVVTPVNTKDKAMMVWQDEKGKPWPLGPNNTQSYCLTEVCLHNTVKFVNQQNFGTVMHSIRESGLISAPSIPESGGDFVNREYMTIILYVFPLLICLLGLLSACCVCTGKWNPALLFSLCSYCCSMLIFIIVGCALFPAVTILSNFCTSAEDVLYTAAPVIHSITCTQLNGTISTNNPAVCLLQPTSEMNITIPLNTKELIKNVFGHCASSPDPFFTIFDAIGQDISPFLGTTVKGAVSQGGNATIKPTLMNPLMNTITGLDDPVEDFFADLGGVYSCENFNALIIGMKDAVCCGFFGPMYWIVASWYIIGYALLCCGCPAGILGKKRFPSKVWGPFAEDPAQLQMNVEGTVSNAIVPISPAYGRGTVNPTTGLVNVAPAPSEDTHLMVHMKSDYDNPYQDNGYELKAL